MTAPPSSSCQRRPTCRLCGSSEVSLVLELAPTPPANEFVGPDAVAKPQASYPLDVFFCEGCGHVQLLDVVDPAVLFENYVYVSGTSPVFVKHFDDYAQAVIDLAQPAPGSLVVDVGSNDGTLLKAFQARGHQVLGIDPAKAIAAAATQAGIDTRAAFFTPALAADLRAEKGPAGVVTANNVFAHIDDLAGVVDGIRTLLAPDGVFVFEVSYLVDVVEQCLFDTIYHEHLAYHSVKPLVRFLGANGLELIEAQRVDSHGGSLRGIAQVKGGPRAVGDSVAQAIAEEERLGLDKAETLRAFAAKIDGLKTELSALLHSLKAQGKTIAGFGAPAKATTLMHHFGIGADLVDFIIDDSPLKQGLYTPGLHIPVVPSNALYQRKPDYVVVLAWNFARPIIAKHQAFLDAGGHFIIPIPALTIV